MEAVKTDVLGADNVLKAAINSGVKRVVCLSIDKAVYPINAMGTRKALMEKAMVAASLGLEKTSTTVCGARHGNVMVSRGSVISLFLEQIGGDQPITITDPNMTRFMMTLDGAVDLVIYAFQHGNNGNIFVQKAPAATIAALAKAMLDLLGMEKYPVKMIGTRHL